MSFTVTHLNKAVYVFLRDHTDRSRVINVIMVCVCAVDRMLLTGCCSARLVLLLYRATTEAYRSSAATKPSYICHR